MDEKAALLLLFSVCDEFLDAPNVLTFSDHLPHPKGLIMDTMQRWWGLFTFRTYILWGEDGYY